MDIFVRNTNDFDHTDHYNGMEFDFPKGERVLVPVEAAMHMFGFNKVDKTDNLSRLGWANLPNDEGAKKLAKFIFTQAVMIEQPVEEIVPPDEAEPPVATA